MYNYKIKRCFDLIGGILCFLLLFWVCIIIGIIIKLESHGPVLFKQKRIGMNKKEFYILKFRTMYINTPSDVPTHEFDNSKSYITKVGSFLRKTSLDEIPQIINIIKGDMSFVGPRPALWNQYDLIEEREKYGVNNVLPGITGWAQINGRDELPIVIKAKFDGEYVKKSSIGFDLLCILKTITYVCKQEGIKEGIE